MNSTVYGNLALSPQQHSTKFTVIAGGKQRFVVAPNRQLFAPDVYARPVASRQNHSLNTLVLGVAIVLACIFGLSFGIAGMKTSARNSAIAQAAQMEIRVQPGDSLWSLAEEHSIDGLSISETLEVIKDWNGRSSASLYPGESLLVPNTQS